MRKLTSLLLMLFLTSIGFAEKVADLPDIMKPEFVTVDGNDLFILEKFSINKYSLKTFKLEAKFGKRGEGPGEMMETPLICILPDSVLANSVGKFLWFSKEGKLLKEERIFRGILDVVPFKDNFIIAKREEEEGRNYLMKGIYLFNPKFEKIKTIYSTVFDVNFGIRLSGGKKKFKMLRHYVGISVYDDKVFIADTQKGFFIIVFDQNGDQLYTIKKDIESMKVTEAYKKKVTNGLKLRLGEIFNNVKNRLGFYEYFPPMKDFLISDGKIYVQTYKEKDNKHEFIILDLKGNIIKKLFFPLKSVKDYKSVGEVDLYAIKNGKVYELIENLDREVYELHISDID